MGKLENSLFQIITAQHNSLNFLLDEDTDSKIREKLLHKDLEKFTIENNGLMALNIGLTQKVHLLEEETENLRAQVKELIHAKALKIINLVV